MFTEKDKERFNKKWKLDQKTGCHVWIAGKRGGKSSVNPRNSQRIDYGGFWWNGKSRRASRIAYQMSVGPIPRGKVVCHSCDNGMCVNPKHLFLGTHKNNVQDMIQKGRQARGNAIKNQHNTKPLTESDVRTIKQSYPTRTVTRAAFAKQWGITESRLEAILYGHSWNWT